MTSSVPASYRSSSALVPSGRAVGDRRRPGRGDLGVRRPGSLRADRSGGPRGPRFQESSAAAGGASCAHDRHRAALRGELPPGTDAAAVIRTVTALIYYRLFIAGDGSRSVPSWPASCRHTAWLTVRASAWSMRCPRQIDQTSGMYRSTSASHAKVLPRQPNRRRLGRLGAPADWFRSRSRRATVSAGAEPATAANRPRRTAPPAQRDSVHPGRSHSGQEQEPR
jgi:hypothetical protein